ncbi:hypothetical protein EOM86_08325 [Candidatus Nomurabacteria bacterium]|nr:hypothetical protein [Candidatus Nomurabacteria bacterium]
MLKMDIIPGLNISAADSGLNEIESTLDGKFKAGENGIVRILSPDDRKVDFIVFENHTIAHVRSSLGYPAIYPVPESKFSAPARAVLMDLDGTSVRSEHFWMWIIERTISRLMGYPAFSLEDEDEPYVSGHSVSEHLQYCIDKYCPELKVEQARLLYHEITETELDAIIKLLSSYLSCRLELNLRSLSALMSTNT